jgi:hypothetical protein
MLSQTQIESAVDYNNAKNYSEECWKLIQANIGTRADGQPGPKTAKAVAEYQKRNLLVADGKVGDGTLGTMGVEAAYLAFPDPDYIEFDGDVADRLIELTARMESGGRYWACNKDGEYAGRFDKKDKLHRASKHGPTPIHIGLSWGYIQFTQDGGTLGKVLEAAYGRDADTFKRVFGEDYAELLDVTSRSGKSGLQSGKLRGPRVKKVAGADLWKEPWISRFVAAGKMELFQWAQRHEAHRLYMAPAFKHAVKMNLNSERALVVLFDRTVQLGGGGMRKLLDRAGIGSEKGWDDPVADIHEQLRKLERYIKKRDYKWRHRVTKIMSTPELCDWVLLTEEKD